MFQRRSVFVVRWFHFPHGLEMGLNKVGNVSRSSFSTANIASDIMLPKPIAQTLLFWSMRLPLVDPTPVVFGIFFLLAILISRGSHLPQGKSKEHTPKVS
jgi:hypothetical protein